MFGQLKDDFDGYFVVVTRSVNFVGYACVVEANVTNYFNFAMNLYLVK